MLFDSFFSVHLVLNLKLYVDIIQMLQFDGYVRTLSFNLEPFNTFTAIVDLSRSNFSIAGTPLFQLKSAM